MRKVLLFDAIPEQPSGGLLLQLAVTLRQLNINLEALVWTATPPDGTLKVRLVLSPDDKRWLPAIADSIRQFPGVRDVKLLSDDDTAPLPSRGHPFID